jgi:thiol-disulfide isomerase/thioredoxin
MVHPVLVAVLLVLASDPPADDREALKPLAEKALKAAGGEKLRAVKAWTFTEKVTEDGTTTVCRRYFQPPDRFRLEDEVEQAGMLSRSVIILNGDRGWLAEKGETQELSAEEVAYWRGGAVWTTAPILAPSWLSDPLSKLTKLSRVKVGGRAATAVELVRKDAGAFRLYFEEETGKLLKVGKDHKLPNGKVSVTEVILSDFRPVARLLLPHKRANVQGGKVFPEWDLEYQPSDRLDASLFEKPVETRPPKRPAFVTEYLTLKKAADAAEARLFADFEKRRDALKGEAEREAALVRIAQETGKLSIPVAEKVLSAVRPHAADPAALDALVWVVNTSRGSAPGNEAAELLMKHHLTHAQTIQLAYGHRHAPLQWTEPMLRAQLAAAGLPKTDRPHVLFALAEVNKAHSELPELLAQMTDVELAMREWYFGKELLADLRKLDAARAQAEAVRLFTELAESHGSEKAVREVTFGNLAREALFEMQHLSVGKTAPETVGEDTDGVPFKLSDYRGKVVLLSFWGTWCGPCMRMVPHEREIVGRLRDKPFVLIGVNSDTDRTRLKAAMDRAGITWRSFWCGEKGTDGDIPSLWNVHGWPTVYVLDHRGVIRAKSVTGTALDRALDKLVSEVGAGR